MTPTELKSLLHDYLAVLRFPGGAEGIIFLLEDHVKQLSYLEVYHRGAVSLRDLSRLSRSVSPPGRSTGGEQDTAGDDSVLSGLGE